MKKPKKIPIKLIKTHRYLAAPPQVTDHQGALGSKPCTEDTLAVTLSTAKMTSMKASVNTTRKSGVTFRGKIFHRKKIQRFSPWWPDLYGFCSHRKMSDVFFEKKNSRIVEKTNVFFVIVSYPRDDDLWCSIIFPGNIQIWMLIWLCSTFSDSLWGKTSIIGSGKRVVPPGNWSMNYLMEVYWSIVPRPEMSPTRQWNQH